jgi:hypothetical protein
MIKINLLGRTKLKAAKTKKISTASNQTLMAVMAIAVVVMSVGIIYFWQRILVQQDEELSRQIMLAKKEKVRQEGMLRENEVFEKRRKLLETRINVIESLKKNQSGPVQVLDSCDCIQRRGRAERPCAKGQPHHGQWHRHGLAGCRCRPHHESDAGGQFQERQPREPSRAG